MGSVRRRKEIQLFHLGGMTAVISTELKWSLSDETELFSVYYNGTKTAVTYQWDGEPPMGEDILKVFPV